MASQRDIDKKPRIRAEGRWYRSKQVTGLGKLRIENHVIKELGPFSSL